MLCGAAPETRSSGKKAPDLRGGKVDVPEDQHAAGLLRALPKNGTSDAARADESSGAASSAPTDVRDGVVHDAIRLQPALQDGVGGVGPADAAGLQSAAPCRCRYTH
eukprot:jgi/Bigna1/71564/fgenesh1_pg.16_\